MVKLATQAPETVMLGEAVVVVVVIVIVVMLVVAVARTTAKSRGGIDAVLSQSRIIIGTSSR